MVRIAAFSIVAFMKAVKVIFNFTKMNLVGISMRLKNLPFFWSYFKSKISIPAIIYAFLPIPAGVCFFNATPKSFNIIIHTPLCSKLLDNESTLSLKELNECI